MRSARRVCSATLREKRYKHTDTRVHTHTHAHARLRSFLWLMRLRAWHTLSTTAKSTAQLEKHTADRDRQNYTEPRRGKKGGTATYNGYEDWVWAEEGNRKTHHGCHLQVPPSITADLPSHALRLRHGSRFTTTMRGTKEGIGGAGLEGRANNRRTHLTNIVDESRRSLGNGFGSLQLLHILTGACQ